MPNEIERLRTLDEYELGLAGGDPALDELAELMRNQFRVEVASIAVVDQARHHTKASAGGTCGVIARSQAFCDLIVRSGEALLVGDLSTDAQFRDHALVAGGPRFRTYAGVPLRIDGQIVGVVCLIDSRVNAVDDRVLADLTRYARLASQLFVAAQARRSAERLAEFNADGPIVRVRWQGKPAWPLVGGKSALARLIGLSDPEDTARFGFLSFVHPEDRDGLIHVLNSHAKQTPGGDQKQEFEYRLVRPDGREVWVHQYTQGFYGGDGKLIVVEGLLVDQTDQEQLALQVRTALNRLNLVMDAGQLGAWECTIATGALHRSQQWASLVGKSFDHLEPSLLAWKQAIHPLDRARFERAWRDHVEGISPVFSVECRVRHEDGRWIWMQNFGRATEPDANGTPTRIIGASRDVSKRQAAFFRQRNQGQLFDLLNRCQQAFLLEKDVRKACEMLLDPIIELSESQFGFIGEVGYKADTRAKTLVVKAISDISWNAESARLYTMHARSELVFENLDNLFGSTITSESVVVANSVAAHPRSRGVPSGHPALTRFLGLPIKHGDEVLGMIGLANRSEDYDEELLELLAPLPMALGLLLHARRLENQRAAAEAELQRLATRDSLTGLLNRRAFFARMEERFQTARGPLFLVLIDLDHFKSINDAHGHSVGDEVLRAVAAVLEDGFCPSAECARFGGEEFAVVMEAKDLVAALARVEAVRRAVQSNVMTVDGGALSVTFSAGLTPVEADASRMDAAFAAADRALYDAKESGRNRVVAAGLDARRGIGTLSLRSAS